MSQSTGYRRVYTEEADTDLSGTEQLLYRLAIKVGKRAIGNTENGEGYLLTAVKMEDYLKLYESSPEDRQNPYFAPILEKDLSHMPETLILTAEFDPLRDEGEEYGKRLKEANNYVEIHRIPDALHGYFALGIRFLHVQESFEIMNRFLNKS